MKQKRKTSTVNSPTDLATGRQGTGVCGFCQEPLTAAGRTGSETPGRDAVLYVPCSDEIASITEARISGLLTELWLREDKCFSLPHF